jgi:hypothetical protein
VFLKHLQWDSISRERTLGQLNLKRTTGQLCAQEHGFREQLYAKAEEIEDSIQQHLRLYLSSSCLALCEQMQQKLTRELRDIVYDYALESEVRYIDSYLIRRVFKDNPPITKQVGDQDCIFHRPRIFDLGHLADVSYVGGAMHKELTDSCYRGTIFSFDADVKKVVGNLEAALFQTMNLWRTGVELSSSVRKVELATTDRTLLQASHCISALLGLSRLEESVRVTIRVEGYRYHKTSDTPYLTTATSTLFPMFNNLKVKGYTVSVEIVKIGRLRRRGEKPLVRLVGDSFTTDILEHLLRNTHV